MMRIRIFAAVLFMSGCTALANSPMVIDQLRIRSAGFTGCAVDANVITNVVGNMDGSGTWNAINRSADRSAALPLRVLTLIYRVAPPPRSESVQLCAPSGQI